MRLFIDTNVIVDLLAARTPFLRDAAQIFTLADTGKVKLFTSSIAVTTTFYLLQKEVKPEVSRAAIQKLLTMVKVVDAGHSGIIRAINDLQFKDFEDAVQHQSALAAKAKILVTRNEKDFGKSVISVMTPKQVLGLL